MAPSARGKNMLMTNNKVKDKKLTETKQKKFFLVKVCSSCLPGRVDFFKDEMKFLSHPCPGAPSYPTSLHRIIHIFHSLSFSLKLA